MKKNYLSIVIPAYQEAGGLNKALENIVAVARSIQVHFEIVVIDDGSTDNTWDILLKLSHNISELKALRLSRNFGKEYAMCAGLDAAKGDAAIVIDADLQHPPTLITEMVRLWREGFDVVEAKKHHRGNESISSRLFAKAFYWIIERMSGYRFAEMSDYKLLDRKVVDAWKQMGETGVFFRGMSAWTGFRRTVIPFDVSDRLSGSSKWSRVKLFSLAITALVSFSSHSLKLIPVLGLIFFVAALGLGIETIYLRMAGIAVSGFTTVILLQLIIGSIVLICMSIMSEYISRIFDEVKQRPRYIVMEQLGFDSKTKNPPKTSE